MKTLYKSFLLAGLVIAICSCNYLDIVPDETATEADAFADVNAASRYMYSCYGYLPQPNDGPTSLDFMTGDEVLTAFEHETFAHFPKGTYNASAPVISYWNTFFSGLRQCYIMLNNVDKVPGLAESTKKDYIAQAKFLIGYYHFLLARCYGPIILIKEEPSFSTAVSDYLGRTSYDECVEFICQMFDEAAAGLPNTRVVVEYGLATKPAALAMKAKMRLYAASPLFNGNSKFYSNFKDADGNNLMPLTYDANKWVLAQDAFKAAIDAAEAAGCTLYSNVAYDHGNLEPVNGEQHLLRYNIMEAGNKEIIWADSRNEGYYGLQNKSMPYSTNSAWNGVAPTMSMLERFYTKNGLPIDEDPEFNNNQRWSVVTIDEEHADEGAVGQRTALFNLDREPRYYAWVAFQGGFYEVMNAPSSGAYDSDASYKLYSDETHGKLVCDFVCPGNVSMGAVNSGRSNNFSLTGYLNKKGVDPGNTVATSLSAPLYYPWPLMRMAELYLSYAECCVETGDLESAKSYLNRVRVRAGIPEVETSWSGIATLNQAKLREIVRQERMIELYLENNNFWDMRRWLLAETYFNQKVRGLNISASSLEEFLVEGECAPVRYFESPTHYLLPIPLSDINKNPQLIQNPGY